VKPSTLGRAFVAAGVVLGCCLGAGKTAHATLGGDVASVAGNRQHLGGVGDVHVLKLAYGERHELTLPSGLVVHEFVSPTGAVYAVTWRGPRMPDLRELLGPYFTQLESRDAFPHTGHHQMKMSGFDLEIRASGHLHSFSGRAWVPSMVPVGVNIDASFDREVSR
jgi:hypothetical protein